MVKLSSSEKVLKIGTKNSIGRNLFWTLLFLCSFDLYLHNIPLFDSAISNKKYIELWMCLAYWISTTWNSVCKISIQFFCLKSYFFSSKIENKKMLWWLQTSLNRYYQKLWSQNFDVSYNANLIVLPGMFPLNGSNFDRDC